MINFIRIWIYTGIIVGILGAASDFFLYKQKPRVITFTLPLVLGPLAIYFVLKSLYSWIKMRKYL